ncbi:S-adenosyl-L-methionine-dependent methyltransferase [Leucogyrophana mollusca]|uniref:S-adenosyl-L-methionine-dependent methyltransferase n=1 Tax=Leucogyrophana mollusca TaxID=85980 RepID=A0ACB8BPU8_9AGAM|nr:S-adenosyl-L-methionine-dependent methyltransferase [Leucogyrophana mollusca]
MSGKSQLKALLAVINSATTAAIVEYEKAGGEVPTIDTATPHPLDSAHDTLALKKAVRLLEGACQQLCVTLASPQHTITNIVGSYDWACVRVAIRADITNILTEHPDGLHVRELSQKVRIDERKLSRILRLLATRGCYREVKPDVFTNNRLSLGLLSSGNVAILAGMHTDAGVKGASVLYENLTDPEVSLSNNPTNAPIMYALRDKGVKGTLFDLMQSDPKKRENYHRAMIGLGSVTGSLSVLNLFPWNEVATVCDVGSGIGAFSLPLAKTYPHLQITCHDMGEVLIQAREYWDSNGPEVLQRQKVEFLPLDFLREAPVKGQDVYYLRNIIHDWPDAEAAVILRNVRQAMAPHSRLLIEGFVLQFASRGQRDDTSHCSTGVAPEPMLPNFGAGNARMYESDLVMMLLHNARERNLNECLTLGDLAGLSLEKIWDLGESSVLEFKSKQIDS